MPISQITSASIATNTITSDDMSSTAQYYGFKNRIINGAMGIWQRGTSYALTNQYAYGSADRWAFIQPTTANGIANQVASGLTGFQYALKLGRNNGATQTTAIFMLQAIETVNSIDLAGQSVTLSFWAKAGANFSGSSISAIVYSGTGTDQSVANMGGGLWTGATYPIASSTSITTTWTRYTFTGTLPSNLTQAGISISYTPTGTAGADDNLYITGVQLEKGSTATSFDYRPYGTELALCQRYYLQINSGGNNSLINGFCNSTTAFRGGLSFPQVMRSAPTFTSSSAGSFYVQTTTTNAVPTALTMIFSTTQNAYIAATGLSPLIVAGQGACFIDNGTTFLGFSSEL